jgi:hypothetical protein
MKSFGKVWNWSTVNIEQRVKGHVTARTSFRKVVIVRVERLSMKVASDSESIVRGAGNPWDGKIVGYGGTATAGDGSLLQDSGAISSAELGWCNDLMCGTPRCVELPTMC